MRLIGLTGGIATGKSTVAGLLAEHGAWLIDADRLARDAVRPGEPALARIVERFGAGILAGDGTLDRVRLGEVVFADPAARLDLERITHPRITELIQQRVGDALAHDAPVVIVDIPLLFENRREEMFEGVLLVYAPRGVQLQRLAARDHLDTEAAEQRVAAQQDIEQKRDRATWVIDNSGDAAETRRQVDAWWAEVAGV